MFFRVLITFVEWRKKYVFAIGDPQCFDGIVDVSSIVGNKASANKYTEFTDQLPCERPETLEQLVETLATFPAFEAYFLFPKSTRKAAECVSRIEKDANAIHLIANRKTLIKRSFFGYFRNRLFSSIFKRIKYPGAIEIETVFTNSIVVNAAVLKKFSPKKICGVRALDAPVREKTYLNQRIGAFFDSYLPFHGEMSMYTQEGIPAEEFYTRLNMFLKWAADEYSLSAIYFCSHPNSAGEELEHVDVGFHTSRSSRDVASEATHIFSFGSGAGFLGCRESSHVYCIDFPDFIPKTFSRFIHQRARLQAADVIIIDKNKSIQIKRKFFKRARRAWRLRSMATDCPSVSSLVFNEKKLFNRE